MLIRYTVENFMSFGAPVTFSMIPGLVRSLSSHKIKSAKRNGIDLLKLGMIYGANASGKSNLIKSMRFVQRYILDGVKPDQNILLITNKLNSECFDKPSRFEIEFRKNNKNYAYGFIINKDRVFEEWLYEIYKNSNDKKVYKRTIDENGVSKVDRGEKLKLDKKESEFLDFIGKGTRPNQLFLTECYQRNVKNNIKSNVLEDVINWFKYNLTIIFPDSKFGGLLFELETNEDFGRSLKNYLKTFDAGVDGIELKDVNFDTIREIPEEIKEDIAAELKDHAKCHIVSPNSNAFFIIKNKSGKLIASKVFVKHKVAKSQRCVHFEIDEESDGTQRLIDLIPALMDLSKSDKVCFIDEIDRSLHPNLTKRFLELFIKLSSESKSQLIVTTHDTNLLDLKDFRRDEIWFVEKDKEYQSQLYSLNEFNERFDKKVQKAYLQGRYGAVPSLKYNIIE